MIAPSVELLISKLNGVTHPSEKQWYARCPSHDDHRASLSVWIAGGETIMLHCHAGCAPYKVLAAVGLTFKDLRGESAGADNIAAVYPYRDGNGKELYQTVRLRPKDFRQRRPDGNGGWIWNMKGIRPVPYRLPQLLADQAGTVVVVEGEKDADTLSRLGFLTTTNHGGADKWKNAHSRFLAGRSVVVLPDADAAGEKHAATVAVSLRGLAASVKIVRLPGLSQKQDVSDWIEAGGTKEQLEKLISESPELNSSGDFESPELPEVTLPGGAVPIYLAAERLGELLASTGEFYLRGGLPFRLSRGESNEPVLRPLRPAAVCSDFERVAALLKERKTKEGSTVEPSICSETTARLLLESEAFRRSLPPITVVSPSPVLIERGGKLIEVTGYDRESGVFAGGEPSDEIKLPEAVGLINEIFADFKFSTDGDRARAIAAIVTPAMLLGGILGARAPIDLGEADKSQSGKGYRNKLCAAVYGCTQRTITQRPASGVGSIQESFDAALVAGAGFITIDNFRGKLDLPGLESFMTENLYFARIPYQAPLEIDPRRITIAFTSNCAALTPDLANRSSIVRIQKQEADYEFRRYPEGDLLDHVAANRQKFWSAIVAVIREWFSRGKPERKEISHDFRRWARVLSYIVHEIISGGEILDGHRAAQERVSNPGMNWLRDVALAACQDGREGHRLRAGQLLDLILDKGIETPGVSPDVDLSDGEQFRKTVQAVGRKLARVFSDNPMAIDDLQIERFEFYDSDGRIQKEYSVTRIPREITQTTALNPSSPLCDPEYKNDTPLSPNGSLPMRSAHARTCEGSQDHSGYTGQYGSIGGTIADHDSFAENFSPAMENLTAEENFAVDDFLSR